MNWLEDFHGTGTVISCSNSRARLKVMANVGTILYM